MSASSTNSAAYSQPTRRSFSRAFSSTAPSTLVRIAKNTSAFTIQVVPKSSANVTRLRVSSNMNAAPRKKKCQSKRRIAARGTSTPPITTATTRMTRIAHR